MLLRVLSVSAFLYCGWRHITKAALLLQRAAWQSEKDAHWGWTESPVGPLLITARNHIFEVRRCSQPDKFKAEIEKHAEMAAGRESGVGLGEKRRKRSQRARALVLCSISKIGRLSTKTKATSTSKQIPS
jgi:hypothetical protein